jgi:hypothetical protein
MTVIKLTDDRMEIIHSLPCVACEIDGQLQPNRTEAHHVVRQSYRRLSGGDMATLNLCGWHHRSEPIMGVSKSDMARRYGPSLADNKRAFVRAYGTELELLDKVNAQIETRKSA